MKNIPNAGFGYFNYLILNPVNLKWQNKLMVVLITLLISCQTIYHFCNSVKEESTVMLMSSSETDNEPNENELDETESLEFLIQNSSFNLAKFLSDSALNNTVVYILHSFNERVPIPPPEA